MSMYQPISPRPHKPRDLPMATIVCTNCGQWLADEETIEGAMPPHLRPRDPRDTAAWLSGEITDDDIELAFYCPRCGVDLSDKPPRRVIIMYADALYPTYPTIKDLIEEKEHLEERIRIRTVYLHKHEERLALAGLISSEGVEHEVAAEKLQEEISTLRKDLDAIRKEVQDKLESSRL